MPSRRGPLVEPSRGGRGSGRRGPSARSGFKRSGRGFPDPSPRRPVPSRLSLCLRCCPQPRPTPSPGPALRAGRWSGGWSAGAARVSGVGLECALCNCCHPAFVLPASGAADRNCGRGRQPPPGTRRESWHAGTGGLLSVLT